MFIFTFVCCVSNSVTSQKLALYEGNFLSISKYRINVGIHLDLCLRHLCKNGKQAHMFRVHFIASNTMRGQQHSTILIV